MQKSDPYAHILDCDELLDDLDAMIAEDFGELPTQHYVIVEEPPKKAKQAPKPPKKAAKKSK